MFGTVLLFILFVLKEARFDRCPENCYCDGIAGECYHCKPGWYGYDCMASCRYCDQGGCSRNKGECYQCDGGFYGRDCTKICPSNCLTWSNGKKYCEREHRDCSEGCNNGWHGQHCDKACSKNCRKLTCTSYNGRCTMGCEHGWHERRCDKPCNTGCVNNTCSVDGDCTLGCIDGFYGRHCQHACPPNCRLSKCEIDLSFGIPACRHDCNDGWYYINCEFRCKDNCLRCDRFSGKCDQCQHGWFGPDCNKTCIDKCKGNICDIQGTCKDGCYDGYYGGQCQQQCDAGCINCDQINGTCLQCKPGFYGQQCIHECSLCKSGACSGDGQCRKGCLDGFRGSRCEHKCSTNCLICKQFSEGCHKCETGWSGERCDPDKNIKSDYTIPNSSGTDVVGILWFMVTATVLSLTIDKARNSRTVIDFVHIGTATRNEKKMYMFVAYCFNYKKKKKANAEVFINHPDVSPLMIEK